MACVDELSVDARHLAETKEVLGSALGGVQSTETKVDFRPLRSRYEVCAITRRGLFRWGD